ncbi:MAG: hypothetical protein ACFFCQ_18240 [Promethearchaeota archaeon]
MITTFTDMGPMPVLNLSSLDDYDVMNLGVVGMTILSMGTQHVDTPMTFRLHGPIPVPKLLDYEALAMTLTVTAESTEDVRVERYGRLSSVMLIFDVKHRHRLIPLHTKIEETLRNEIKKFTHERELNEADTFKNILEKIENLVKAEEAEVSPPEEEVVVKPSEEEIKVINVYSIDLQGELIPILLDGSTDIDSYPVLLIANTILKQIFVIKIQESISPRKMFLASSAASKLNITKFKNEFSKRDVIDPLETQILLEKLNAFIQASS